MNEITCESGTDDGCVDVVLGQLDTMQDLQYIHPRDVRSVVSAVLQAQPALASAEKTQLLRAIKEYWDDVVRRIATGIASHRELIGHILVEVERESGKVTDATLQTQLKLATENALRHASARWDSTDMASLAEEIDEYWRDTNVHDHLRPGGGFVKDKEDDPE